jgi:PAS domain S-box-containing protein
MGRTLDKEVVLGLGLVAALLVLGGVLSYRNTNQLVEDSRWVAHTHEVMDLTDSVLLTLVDAETGERGFILTGNDSFLEPYQAALQRLQVHIISLKEKTQDNSTQQLSIVKLEKLTGERLALLKQGVAERRSFTNPELASTLLSKGKVKMDAIRELVGEMKQHEAELLVQRQQRSVAAYRIALTSNLLTAVTGLLLVGAFGGLLYRSLLIRQKAAAAVREQRQLLQTTLTSIGDAVIATDAEGRVTFLNTVAQVLTGYEAAEASNRPLDEIFRIINEETRRSVENPTQRALKEGKIVGLANHSVLIAKDGTEVPIEDSASPIRDEQDKVSGAVLIFRDVAEKRRTEKALRLSEEELRRSLEVFKLALKVGKIGHWEWNALTDENKWSPEIEALYGLQPGGFEGGYEGWAKLLHPDDLAKAEEDVRRALATGEYFTEFRVIWPDGSVHWLETRAHVFKDAEDKPERILGVNMDVTERKRTEEALRAATDELRIVTDSMAAPVTRCGPDFRYRWASKPYADWIGRPLGQIIGHPIADIVGPEAFALLRPYFERVLRGEAVSYESEVNFQGLGLRWVNSKYTPTFDDGGKPNGWVAVVLDITARKQMEQSLKEADHRKDEFLAMLAHELRNPLAPIRNALHILQMDGANGEIATQARDMMERQVAQMVRLVDDLMDVSRITRGKINLVHERLELARVIDGALETSRPLIEAAKHELAVELSAEPLAVVGDLTRLAQVVSNLLNNAAKYTPEGGHIRLLVAREGEQAVIRVRDDGMGIAPAMLPRIFDMFTQADKTLNRAQGGLGIGLTLVRRLVEMHGGQVEAHSEGAGRGSEFVIRLPLAPKTEEGKSMNEPVGTAPVRQQASRKVLVVDDNQDSADSLGMLLSMRGHEVRTALDGPAALAAARTFRPDVILLDIGLPGMNGYEVARQMRQMPELNGALLIAQTGWGQEEDRRKSTEAGFDEHLVKPVDPAALQELLSRREVG